MKFRLALLLEQVRKPSETTCSGQHNYIKKFF
jgi:hypothetical protein